MNFENRQLLVGALVARGPGLVAAAEQSLTGT